MGVKPAINNTPGSGAVESWFQTATGDWSTAVGGGSVRAHAAFLAPALDPPEMLLFFQRVEDVYADCYFDHVLRRGSPSSIWLLPVEAGAVTSYLGSASCE